MTNIDAIRQRASMSTQKSMWESAGSGVVRVKYNDGSFSEFRLKVEDADFVVHASDYVDQVLLSNASITAECDRLRAMIDSDLVIRVDNLTAELAETRLKAESDLASSIRDRDAQIAYLQKVEQAARAVCSPEIIPLLRETDSRATRAMDELKASLLSMSLPEPTPTP